MPLLSLHRQSSTPPPQPTTTMKSLLIRALPASSILAVIVLLTPERAVSYEPPAPEIAIDGDTALIGVRSDDDNGVNSGSAYVFAILGDSDGDGVVNADDNCPVMANSDVERQAFAYFDYHSRSAHVRRLRFYRRWLRDRGKI